MIILDEDKAEESLRMAQALYVNDVLPPYTPPKRLRSIRQSRSHHQLSSVSPPPIPPPPNVSYNNNQNYFDDNSSPSRFYSSAMQTLTAPPLHPSHANSNSNQAHGLYGTSYPYQPHAHGRSASIPPVTPPRSPRSNPTVIVAHPGGNARPAPLSTSSPQGSSRSYSPTRHSPNSNRYLGPSDAPSLTLTPSPNPNTGLSPGHSPHLSRSASSPNVKAGPGSPGRPSSSGSGSTGSGRLRNEAPAYTNVHMQQPPPQTRSPSHSTNSTTFLVGDGSAPAYTQNRLQLFYTGSSSYSTATTSTTSTKGTIATSTSDGTRYVARGVQRRSRPPRSVRPSNTLSIHRDGAAITGTYVVDPSLQVPEWFWGEEVSEDEGYVSAMSGDVGGGGGIAEMMGVDVGKKKAKAKNGKDGRPNARFVTRRGEVDLDLWVCEGCVRARPQQGTNISSGDRGQGEDGQHKWEAWEALWLGAGSRSSWEWGIDSSERDGKGRPKAQRHGEGTRHADVEVVSEVGSVAMKLHAPSTQPLRVSVCTQHPSATISIALPRSFVGPVYVYTCPINLGVGRRESQDDKEREKETERKGPTVTHYGVMSHPTSNASLTSISSMSTSNSQFLSPDPPFAKLPPAYTGSSYGGSSVSSGYSAGSLTPTPSTVNLTAGTSAPAVGTAPTATAPSSAPASTPVTAHADIALSILASYAPGAQFAKGMIECGRAHTVLSSSSNTSYSCLGEKEKGRDADRDKEKEKEKEKADGVAKMFKNGHGIGTVKTTVYFVGREGEAETWQAAGMPVPGVDASHSYPLHTLSSLHIYTRSTASCVEISYSDAESNSGFGNASDEFEYSNGGGGKFGLIMGAGISLSLTGSVPRGVANKLGKWLGKREREKGTG